MEGVKVVANVRISEQVKDEVSILGEKIGLSYADMFRKLLTLGIAEYKTRMREGV